MKINLAKNCGFCGGVNRAYAIVKKEFKGKKNKNQVLILGSLVHNENVMETINGWGIRKVKTLRTAKEGDVVIITAHGVGKDVINKVLEKKCKLFDATCPKVSIIHKTVMESHINGCQVVIFGDKKHKEVKGINGWCDGKAAVVSNPTEAKQLSKKWTDGKSKKPIIIVSQTTQNVEQYQNICDILFEGAEKSGREIKSINTICDATSSRQKEARRSAIKNDAVVVVGGRKSANTRRLWRIAKSINPLTIWIEELDKDAKKKISKIISKAKSVAVISGASTPQWDIQKIAVFLSSK